MNKTKYFSDPDDSAYQVLNEGRQGEGDTIDHGQDYGVTAVLYDDEEYNALGRGPINGNRSLHPTCPNDRPSGGGPSYQTLGDIDPHPAESVNDKVYFVLDGNVDKINDDAQVSFGNGPKRKKENALSGAKLEKNGAGQNRISDPSKSRDEASEHHVYELASTLESKKELRPAQEDAFCSDDYSVLRADVENNGNDAVYYSSIKE